MSDPNCMGYVVAVDQNLITLGADSEDLMATTLTIRLRNTTGKEKEIQVVVPNDVGEFFSVGI